MIKSPILIILFITFISLITGCGNTGKPVYHPPSKEFVWPINPHFKYNLASPTIEMKMSVVLKEISGLTYLPDSKEIAAINDELGNIYKIDASTGSINEKLKFDRFGDFEAVEYIDGVYYVCNSKGTILEIERKEGAVTKSSMQTRLDYHNNVEGMAYDKNNNRLVLACKDDAQITNMKKVKGKAVYSFPMNERKLNTTPLFTVRDKHLLAWFEKNVGKINDKVEERITSFSPSGIAIHPITGHYYITSARGDLVGVFDEKGNVMHIELARAYMEQIEGVCFDENGTLFISSEGVNKRGRIFAFKPL